MMCYLQLMQEIFNWRSIRPHKDEEAHTVKAQHEPLISESLFYQVQDVLDGRKRHYRLPAANQKAEHRTTFIITVLVVVNAGSWKNL
jgi:hypothetical protein